MPVYPVFNPGYAEADSQQIWGTAEADVIREGMTPQVAAGAATLRSRPTSCCTVELLPDHPSEHQLRNWSVRLGRRLLRAILPLSQVHVAA